MDFCLHYDSSIFLINRTSTATFDLNSKMSVHADQVCEWRSPEQLKELLDLELREGGESESKILQRCRDAIKYSVKTSRSSNDIDTL